MKQGDCRPLLVQFNVKYGQKYVDSITSSVSFTTFVSQISLKHELNMLLFGPVLCLSGSVSFQAVNLPNNLEQSHVLG